MFLFLIFILDSIMHDLFVILTVIFVFIDHGLTTDCPNSSSEWCETEEIAQACGVRKRILE